MSGVRVIPGLDASGYRRSLLHADDRIWVEKNCYVDIWIEVLHALGLEPRAVLSFVVAIDFQGDQWTFFKPPHEDIRALYGIDVQELNVWRPLLDHAIEYIAAGKLVSTEADAWWLPDTQGTDYRTRHTKTTIVIENLDPVAGTLGYFHNAGYHRLGGEDFRQLFQAGMTTSGEAMPLYAEFLRLDRMILRTPEDLADRSAALLRRYLALRPADNPMRRFAARFAADLPELQARGLAHYHAWAFATIRQFGAAFELAALHLDWLAEHGRADTGTSAEAFRHIATQAKFLILKTARAVNGQRPLDASSVFDDLAEAWEVGMRALDQTLGAHT